MPVGTIQKNEEHYAIVKIERQDMCGECHACEVLAEKKSCELKCFNKCKAKPGDLVEVELSQNLFIRATMIMYGIPLLGLILGVLLGALLPQTWGAYIKESAMIILGLGFMTLGLVWIRYKDKKERYNELLPVVKKIIEHV